MLGPKGKPFWNQGSHVVRGERAAMANLTHHYNTGRVWLISYGFWAGQASALTLFGGLQLLGSSALAALFWSVIGSSVVHGVIRGVMVYRYSIGDNPGAAKAARLAEKARKAEAARGKAE